MLIRHGRRTITDETFVQVQVLEFDLERDELRPVAVYVHAHEIWSITPSPTDPCAFITVHNEGAHKMKPARAFRAVFRHKPLSRYGIDSTPSN